MKEFVNCKTCGAPIDVPPEDAVAVWQLQCDPCKKTNTPLPAGYEDLIGGAHDNHS